MCMALIGIVKYYTIKCYRVQLQIMSIKNRRWLTPSMHQSGAKVAALYQPVIALGYQPLSVTVSACQWVLIELRPLPLYLMMVSDG